ncbi:MAG TPA: YSC84-related protein [Steroidobacteraceae bacterium]|nr:YSC84-related protein [Steroidobacteraceae bacterium]
MKKFLVLFCGALSLAGAGGARADEYSDTAELFRNAGESAAFFHNCYGYAVFPTVGKGGLVVGGAYGTGHVFAQGKYTGEASVTQLSVGFQAGGQAYSMIVFFENRTAYDEFTSGSFEFGADVGAVAITAAAGATAGTTGASASASATENAAKTAGRYYKGMAVFTIVKGGAMYQATVAGQKFRFKAAK